MTINNNALKIYVKHFKDITKKDVGIAGGKGASLGEMTRAGIPIPEGFVILSIAFEDFVKESKLAAEIDATLERVDINNMQTIENASEKIQAMIKSSKIPKSIVHQIMESYSKLNAKYVAVRSSATSEDSANAAWAGQLNSYLNTLQDKLLNNVRRCWASLYTPRAIFYSIEKGLHRQKNSVAVVVQKMVDSDVSGIAFSVHPVNQDRNQIIIEAGLGLGEAIVSGQVTPDSYIIHKKDLSMIEKNINMQSKMLIKAKTGGNDWINIDGYKQKLSDEKVRELAKIIIKIENHYGFPCDIEWAVEKEKIYIVQSRPITTLTDNNIIDEKDVDKETETVMKNQKHHDNVIKSSVEFIHMDKEIFKWGPILGKWLYLCSENVHAIYDKDRTKYPIGRWPHSIYLFKDDKMLWLNDMDEVENCGEEAFKAYLMGKNRTKTKKYYELCKKRLVNTIRKALKHPIDSMKTIPIVNALSDISRMYADFFESSIATEAANYGVINMLKSSLQNRVPEDKIMPIIEILTAPTTESLYQKEEYELLRTKNINVHAKKYAWLETGYGGARQLDIGIFTRRKKELPKDIHDITVKRFQEITRRQNQIKKQYKLSKDVMKLGIRGAENVMWQDNRKEYVNRTIYMVNLLICQLSKITKIPLKDFEKCAIKEIINALRENNIDALKEIIEKRKNSFGFDMNYGNIVELNEEQTNAYWKTYTYEKAPENTEQVKGVVANPSKEIITGTVRIVIDPHNVHEFNAGDILVTAMTTPDYIFLMKKASAIVTDTGGLTSHAAVTSRELQKPCVIGTKFATRIFKDGDYVEVDADTGVVKILKDEAKKVDTEPIILEQMFSREKSAMYMMMWNISENIGYKDFIDYDIQNSLFIYDDNIQKTSVWYNPNEAKHIAELLFNKVKTDKNFVKKIINRLNANWKIIFPYLSLKRNIKTVAEFEKYYNGITMWWSAMNTVYPLINNPDITKKESEIFLTYRKNSERYTGAMDTIIQSFWNTHLKKEHQPLTKYLLIEEAKALNNKVANDNIQSIKNRVTGYCIHKERIYDSNHIENIMKENNLRLHRIDYSDIRGIKGVTAYSGKTKGYVKKIITKNDIINFKEGEILVAEVTFPDHVLAMKKAAAIVTDEGGLTCHAAIVSRELKIPCIIGTKIATKVLKDGDYIEVDANNGIVKILSSKGYKKVNESREPELNIDDFTFTFESQGTSFIFENIIIDHYMPSGESITMWKDGKKRVLIHKSVMDKMDKQGLTRTPKDTEDAIKRLKGTVDCMNDERSGYNQKPKLTLDDVKHMFSILRDLCQQYLYFDCTYWDSTYKKSEHDASAKKNIKLVENFKNEIRDRLNIAYFGPKSYLSILLKNMCKQFSISFKDIEWYAESEIIDLFNSMKVPVTELKARRISYLYHIDNNSHIKLYSGDAAATLISRFDKPFERTSNIIKGKTANNTGIKVKAPVKIIRRDYSNESITRQNIAKMHKGDILVSETTDPTLMEAFRKASAVITDVGGMLSHAAITARELNLPCIVDTKSATKILHDGDLVEVDADKGIVKIIK